MQSSCLTAACRAGQWPAAALWLFSMPLPHNACAAQLVAVEAQPSSRQMSALARCRSKRAPCLPLM